MDRNEIIQKLETLSSEFEELLIHFDQPKEGMSRMETVSFVSEQYSGIKDRVVDFRKQLEKDERDDRLSRDEEAFLVPAIREVALHCKARKGSKNVQELKSSIYDGQSYCSYWLAQLNA
ncbi:hypothetical protein E4634_20795 [Mangrovimicrobium sediminis]|uniref:Uncharacterized protein n=1 Tax=Mangrovimicrobium sediminis TaxID=2562682 RepID=A0A4Z0LU54_9GAMM|nr:hypothetical protein [Haliea sp. SAOS-164]TGD70779.1 hypothetical protein E4634_20795 [Haliea sp. SAOS-164]